MSHSASQRHDLVERRTIWLSQCRGLHVPVHVHGPAHVPVCVHVHVHARVHVQVHVRAHVPAHVNEVGNTRKDV